jgi:hypothetical protein
MIMMSTKSILNRIRRDSGGRRWRCVAETWGLKWTLMWWTRTCRSREFTESKRFRRFIRLCPTWATRLSWAKGTRTRRTILLNRIMLSMWTGRVIRHHFGVDPDDRQASRYRPWRAPKHETQNGFTLIVVRQSIRVSSASRKGTSQANGTRTSRSILSSSPRRDFDRFSSGTRSIQRTNTTIGLSWPKQGQTAQYHVQRVNITPNQKCSEWTEKHRIKHISLNSSMPTSISEIPHRLGPFLNPFHLSQAAIIHFSQSYRHPHKTNSLRTQRSSEICRKEFGKEKLDEDRILQVRNPKIHLIPGNRTINSEPVNGRSPRTDKDPLFPDWESVNPNRYCLTKVPRKFEWTIEA